MSHFHIKSFFVAFLIVPLCMLVAACQPIRPPEVTAPGNEAIVPDTVEPVPSTDQNETVNMPAVIHDVPAISITLELIGELPLIPGDSGLLAIHLDPQLALDNLTLQVSLAGNVQSFEPVGFSPIPSIEPYIANLEAGSNFATEVQGVAVNQRLTFEFPFVIASEGQGYILVSAISPFIETESATLFVRATTGQVYFSESSFLDLETQVFQAETELEPGDTDFQKMIEKIMRSGANVDQQIIIPDEEPALPQDIPEVEEPESEAPQAGTALMLPRGLELASLQAEAEPLRPQTELEAASPQQTEDAITVQGIIAFSDINNNPYPVRFARVEIWDEEGEEDELVRVTMTNNDGFYSETFDNTDGDETGRDIFVIVSAQGEAVRVIDPSRETPWELGSDVAFNLPNRATLITNIIATNNLGQPQNVAFEVYEAINYLARYLPELGEPLPPKVTAAYPESGDSSFYTPPTMTIHLAGSDAHDWDNIQHEYGHHLQNIYGIANSPGGAHLDCQNLCKVRGKNKGVRLAWGEAWPTAFAIMMQLELGLDQLGIPTVGDTFYTDSKPATAPYEYDLEQADSCGAGEGNEFAIQRVLFDFYDRDDNDDDGLALSPQQLWNAVRDSHPSSFSAFWSAFSEDLLETEKLQYGPVLAEHGIGPRLNDPGDNAFFTRGPGIGLSFSWQGNLSCTTGTNARFELRLLTNEGVISANHEWLSTSSMQVPPDDIEGFFGTSGSGTVTWYVISKDESDPPTGLYYSDPHILHNQP